MHHSPSLNSLHLFIQVARNGSFSETGRRMHLTQPALSRKIRALEDNLGVRLFDREAHRVSLSVAGQALLEVAERLTGAFDAAFVEMAGVLAGRRERVFVGAVPGMGAGPVSRAIAAFADHHPLIDVVLRDSDASVLYQEMRAGRLDLAIITPPDSADIAFSPLIEDPLVAVVRAGGPHDTGTLAPWSLLTVLPFIAFGRQSHVRTMVEDGMRQAGIQVMPHYEVSQLTTAAHLIGQGMAITALPASTMTQLTAAGGRVATRALTGPNICRQIGVAHMPGRPLSASARAFLACVIAEMDTAAPPPVTADRPYMLSA